jgi:hypothetical protein
VLLEVLLVLLDEGDPTGVDALAVLLDDGGPDGIDVELVIEEEI